MVVVFVLKLQTQKEKQGLIPIYDGTYTSHSMSLAFCADGCSLES